MNEETKAAILVEDLRDNTFKAFMVLLIASAIMSGLAGHFAVRMDKEAICEHVIPEARTLTCEQDHGPS
jgi:hypothetical protein